MSNTVVDLMERAEKYLDSADILLTHVDYESCVSRIYYAMFFAVEATLLTKSITTSFHKAIISTFGLHFIKTGIFPKDMDRDLNKAFGKRQISDYSHHFVMTKQESHDLLTAEKNFVTQLNRYLKNGGLLT